MMNDEIIFKLRLEHETSEIKEYRWEIEDIVNDEDIMKSSNMENR